MHVASKKKIVLLGMMTKMPVAGNAWLVAHYMVGFRRLGFDPYYVEAHGIQPAGMLLRGPDEDPAERAAGYIAAIMERFGFGDRWAYQALHDDGACHGLTDSQLRSLYRSAELIINLHGGTMPLAEQAATGRLVYLGTDPVQLELELAEGRPETVEFLSRHTAFFTWGLNYGNSDCGVPVSDQFDLKPTRPPIVPDFWFSSCTPVVRPFTTVGNWRQDQRVLSYQGEVYHWSKHREFLKFIDLPARAGESFELALSSSSIDQFDRHLLESHGWKVRDALNFSTDLDAYRRYLSGSRGEFTVAKDQNVRLRSGWFSERSAQYLAAGRPVITQETGFSNVLPTGRGLFGFSAMDELLEAIEAVNGAYGYHCRAAAEIARECFHYDVVLREFLAVFGLNPRRWRAAVPSAASPLSEPEDLANTAPSNCSRNGKSKQTDNHFAARLGEIFGAQPETRDHPHVPQERAELFHSLDNGSTELEVLNLLHALVLAFKPEVALETGTYLGFGTIAIASALSANGLGHLHTVEIDSEHVASARRHLGRFDPHLSDHVTFWHADSLDFIERYDGPPFGFAFFDGAMSNRYREFDLLRTRGRLAPGAICIFHDTSRFRQQYWTDANDCPEMRAAVERLLKRYGGLSSHFSRGLTILQFCDADDSHRNGYPASTGHALQEPLTACDCRIAVDADMPAELPSNARVRLSCSVENKGSRPLASTAPNPVCFSYRWLDQSNATVRDVEGVRTPFPEPLTPNRRVHCAVQVQTPAEPGHYQLRITLVQEHVLWFDSVDAANAWTGQVHIIPADSVNARPAANGEALLEDTNCASFTLAGNDEAEAPAEALAEGRS